MDDLTKLPHQLNEKQSQCRVIIETPKGSRSKLSYDPETKLFHMKRVLPKGMAFPFDFGFIPSTVGGDGDPLDVLVLMDDATPVGCMLDVRLIGVIQAEQTENGKTNSNDRLLAIAIPSNDYEDVKSLERVNRNILSQIEEFFASYNRQFGKEFRVTGHGGPKEAVRIVKAGSR